MYKLTQNAKKNLQLLGIGIAIAGAIFIATNSGYLWQNLKYEFIKPIPIPPAQTNAQAKSTPDILTIPKLAISVPVKYAQTVSEKEFQALLIDGVVHYPATAMPGQIGNDYIFGHSSDYIWSKGHYKTVFAVLPKIQIGDLVQISDSQGNLFNYKVMSTKVVLPDDLSVLSQDTAGKKILTVQTSYPVGTALKRFVAICELVP